MLRRSQRNRQAEARALTAQGAFDTVFAVEGRLRLANLAEPIFDALKSGEMTLDMAKAYASTESHERQLMVWKSYGANSYYASADTIRRVIANDSMKSENGGAIFGHASGGIVLLRAA